MQGRTLWELRVFCAVVERQSFVTAARELGVSPSSATRAVQTLEEQLGTQLLQRSHKRNFSWTRCGRVRGGKGSSGFSIDGGSRPESERKESDARSR